MQVSINDVHSQLTATVLHLDSAAMPTTDNTDTDFNYSNTIATYLDLAEGKMHLHFG